MDLCLSGRTAVVTGASRGIGLAIARQLVGEGMRVVGAARTETPELAALDCTAVRADLTTAEGAATVVEAALSTLGGVDLLVNNVGGAQRFVPFLELTDDDWEHALAWNLMSAVRVTRGLLPSLLDRGGSIVNISSGSARFPGNSPTPYSAAKAGMNNLARALAEEFGSQLRVNTVSPGYTRTDVWEGPDGVGAQLSAQAGVDQKAFVEGIPAAAGMVTGRMIEPEEIASLVAWLASPHAVSVTGADIRFDGGVTKFV